MKTCMRTINAAMVAIVLVKSAAAQDSKCPVRKAGQTEMTLSEANLFGITPKRLH
jgi:hypothetical protein